MSDIDTAAADSLKVLDPNRPIREADIDLRCLDVRFVPEADISRTKGIKPQFPNGIVSSVSFVSTTNTARSLAGFVSLALALTP